MASSLYRVQRTSTPGTDLLVTLNVINEAFAKLKLLRAAMIQQKDGSAGTAADYVTPAAVFGFVDSDNALSLNKNPPPPKAGGGFLLCYNLIYEI